MVVTESSMPPEPVPLVPPWKWHAAARSVEA